MGNAVGTSTIMCHHVMTTDDHKPFIDNLL
jgi:hypothetical protein